METKNADIIIAGGGLAGLTFALECSKWPFFDSKSIIILEKDDKIANDRTWCFWATMDEPIPPMVFRSWKNCSFHSHGVDKLLEIKPFQYHMVRGADFYQWAKAQLMQQKNIQWVKAEISAIEPGAVSTNEGRFTGQFVINAALRTRLENASERAYTCLLQHFKGWVVRTPAPTFDPETVRFMDYKIPQEGQTRFVYVLPFSPTEALVEFTVFSESLIPMDEYDAALRNYLKDNLQIADYEIVESEFGVIPMTDIPLGTQSEGVIHIGTPGGFVKGSSGYAFKRTQRKLADFAADWAAKGRPNPAIMRSSWRYRFYDSVMLRVLKENAVPGSHFFSLLFNKLPASLVFRFLDEDSTFAEDLKLLSAPPTWPFFKTALKQIPILSKI